MSLLNQLDQYCDLFLGTVVRFGNNKSIKEVSGPLAERLFDQTPQVRDSVTSVIGDWLMNLPDRYSYFHIMIPLLLTRYHCSATYSNF